MAAALGKFLYPHSIFQAFDGQGLEKAYETRQPTNGFSASSILPDIKEGTLSAVKDLARGFFIALPVTLIANHLFDTTQPIEAEPLSLIQLIFASVVEQIAFRALQTGMCYLQLGLKEDAPEWLQQNSVFNAVVSTTTRTVYISLFYASLHYFLGSDSGRSDANVVSNFLVNLLQPTSAVAFEETGSFAFVTAAHITRNLLVEGLGRLTS